MPINAVRDILPQLEKGKVVRGRIGVTVQDVPRDCSPRSRPEGCASGALVADVTPSGPAAKAGIEPGDVIVEFNGKPVTDRNTLVQLVMATKPGTTVPMKILRDKQEKSLSVAVEELTSRPRAARRQAATRSRKRPAAASASRWARSAPTWRGGCRCRRARAGALVTDVDPTSAAARAGVRPGDVILQVNRQAGRPR